MYKIRPNKVKIINNKYDINIYRCEAFACDVYINGRHSYSSYTGFRMFLISIDFDPDKVKSFAYNGEIFNEEQIKDFLDNFKRNEEMQNFIVTKVKC